LSITGSTGLISGTITATGTSTVTLSASNATGTGTSVLTIVTGTDPNAALLQSATASSVQAGNNIANANDGNGGTRWAAADGTYPQWWRVDLGASKTLSRVDIAWLNATTRAYKYTIDVSSDDVTYTTVLSNVSNVSFTNTTDKLNGISARYVRISVSGCTQAGNASAWEIAVFGH
jgi:F5/8 type C domain